MNNKKEVKDIVIIGSGGIGREVAFFIEEINEKKESFNLLGFIDDNADMWGQELNDHKVLGGIEYLKNMKVKPSVVIAIGNCDVKKKIVEALNNEFEFESIIHPTIKINRYCKVGIGSIIYPGVIITVNSEIGKHVTISGHCAIGHDCVIGDYSTLLWGTKLSGYATIGDEVMVGIGTKIIQNISVDSNSKIRPGRIIVEDVLMQY
ncbi:MAG: transferase [Clostridium sp.]